MDGDVGDLQKGEEDGLTGVTSSSEMAYVGIAYFR